MPTNREFDFKAFNQEFWPGYLKAVGKTDKYNAQDFIKCGDAQVTFTERVKDIHNSQGPTFLAKMTAKANIVQELVKMGSDCWVEIDLMFLPQWKALREDPVKTIGLSYYNQLKNYPEVFWLSQFINEDIQKKDYDLAGQATGVVQNLLGKGIY